MDWITDCAYRLICKDIFQKYWSPDDELMIRTEFMSADWYKHNPFWVNLHIMKTEKEHDCIAQIFWWNEETLLHCALDIEEKYNYAWIELNMWCPSPKIMKCAAWSGMLKDKQKTLSILKNLSTQLSTPLSLKTRIWLSNDDIEEQFDFLIQASKYVWMIWVHGRTYKQSHSWFVDRDFIWKLKKALPDTIIIWNWWLRSYADAKRMCVPQNEFYEEHIPYMTERWYPWEVLSFDHLSWTNLDWNMIAQSAIWNPRILTPHTPTLQERVTTIFAHLDLFLATEIYFKTNVSSFKEQWRLIMPRYDQLLEIIQHIDRNLTICENDPDIRISSPVEFRKFLFNYVSWIPESKSLKKKIPAARTYTQLTELLKDFFWI